MRLNPAIDIIEIVRMTPGYVGADISTLCKEASIQAVSRIINEQSSNEPMKDTQEVTEENEEGKEENEEDDEELKNLFIELTDF